MITIGNRLPNRLYNRNRAARFELITITHL
jgi:hypothetical protein